MQPKNIGLYFGSFNPIHIGHLILANYLAEHSNLDEIWLVVTPQNPFKDKNPCWIMLHAWRWWHFRLRSMISSSLVI